jgi:hypothetical protein
MKRLGFVFALTISTFTNAQFEANEYGFVLNQYIRDTASRKKFIDKYPEISNIMVSGGIRIYNNRKKIQSIELVTIPLDSLLLNQLSEFNNAKYKIFYKADYNEYHIAESERIVIKNRFNLFLKRKETYYISLEYRFLTGMGLSQMPQVHINFPDTYLGY